LAYSSRHQYQPILVSSATATFPRAYLLRLIRWKLFYSEIRFQQWRDVHGSVRVVTYLVQAVGYAFHEQTTIPVKVSLAMFTLFVVRLGAPFATVTLVFC
jgi:hypothetical protein